MIDWRGTPRSILRALALGVGRARQVSALRPNESDEAKAARELALRTPWTADYCMRVIRARDRIAPDMTDGGFADLVMRFGLEGLITFADAAKVYIEGTSPLTGCLRGRMRQEQP